jgi:hypothetical protein
MKRETKTELSILNMFKSKSVKVILLSLLFLPSCGKEQFSTKKEVEQNNTSPIAINSSTSCSDFTLIKPQVDFLFLWDNSTSSIFINNEIKKALDGTIDLISSRFDYHVMMAPLISEQGAPVNAQASFFSETPAGLSGSALSLKIDRSNAGDVLNNFTLVPGGKEEGAQRAFDLIRSNMSNGIFRQNAYLNVVVMSNEDDFSWAVKFPPADSDRITYTKAKIHQLLCLRGFYNPGPGYSCSGIPTLSNTQMRFHSIVAFPDKVPNTTCGLINQWRKNLVYKEMSSKIYSTPYTSGVDPNDQESRTDLVFDSFLKVNTFDSYDICRQSSFSRVFDGINSSIQDILLKHKYNFWPVATSGSSAIDPNEVRVFKDGVEMNSLSSPVGAGANGFTFTNSIQTVNTRFQPTPGEPFTGFLVQLFGNAQVTFPECMTVTTQTPKDFFGYIALQTKPLESSIVVKINGQTVPKSTTNGWQLLKSGSQPTFFNSKNIKISGPGNFCPGSSKDYCAGSPAINKSGFMLQVFGTAVYSNGASIEVVYDPAP